MAFRTDRCEVTKKIDAYGKKIGACGDTIELFLTIKNNRIERVSFKTDGCISTRACANTISILVEGKTIHQAWEMTPGKVINYLKVLPKEFEHCAELAVVALHRALANFQEIKQSPWKKLYHKNR